MLTNCPECGGQVSSDAKTCVHCGYSFAVCPACRKAVAADATDCPFCGHGLLNTPPVSAPPPATPAAEKEREKPREFFMDVWKKESPSDYAAEHRYTVMRWVSMAVGMIALFGAVIAAVVYSQKNVIERLSSYKSTLIWLRIFGCGFFFFATIESIFKSCAKVWYRLKGSTWANKNQVDAAKSCLDFFGKYGGNRKVYERGKEIAFVSKNRSFRTFSVMECVGAAVCLFAAFMAEIILWDETIAETLMRILLNTYASGTVSNSDLWSMLHALFWIYGLLMISAVFVLIMDVVFSRKKKAWFERLSAERRKEEKQA